MMGRIIERVRHRLTPRVETNGDFLVVVVLTVLCVLFVLETIMRMIGGAS